MKIIRTTLITRGEEDRNWGKRTIGFQKRNDTTPTGLLGGFRVGRSEAAAAETPTT
jgi:hypothetical protein